MKPIIYSSHGPVYTDALLRSMDLMYPSHDKPIVFKSKDQWNSGYERLSQTHNIDIVSGNFIGTLEDVSTQGDTVLLLSDFSLFIRPFNTSNNASYDRLLKDDHILAYYLYLDKNIEGAPANVYNYKNELGYFRSIFSYNATIMKSKDIRKFIKEIVSNPTMHTFASTIGNDIFQVNRIYDNNRSVQTIRLQHSDRYNKPYEKGMIIDINPFLYWETNIITEEFSDLPMIWR